MDQNNNFQNLEKIINNSIKEATVNLARGFALYNKALFENISKINPFITTGLIEFINEKISLWDKNK
ncbi:MAG TPA: hypothetical protein PKW55_06150 [Spirochaetota bacterium]|nr:hypothetical protein [Spirochaetota bacterium]HOM38465.1 hypothetical protein [Spirochaetota bacterium]HPQ49005.1 hypothetical protein [Spirochaetota bacterium]